MKEFPFPMEAKLAKNICSGPSIRLVKQQDQPTLIRWFLNGSCKIEKGFQMCKLNDIEQ